MLTKMTDMKNMTMTSKTTRSLLLSCALVLAGCAAPVATFERDAGAASAAAPWTGKVLVTENALPAAAKATVLGKLTVSASSGYGGGARLYPQLADEARKVGANAVVTVTGYNRPTAFSWAAPHVSGVAVRVDDGALAQLKGESF